MHMLSEVGSDNKKTHADISMKLGKMFITMSDLNISYQPIKIGQFFKMSALKSKMATTINVKLWNEDLTSYKEIK